VKYANRNNGKTFQQKISRHLDIRFMEPMAKSAFFMNSPHEDPVILVACRGATCGAINVTEPYSYANSNAMALDSVDTTKIDIGYLAKYLEFRGFQNVVSGSAQPQITSANIAKVEVMLPPLEEQRRIAAILDKAQCIRAKAARRTDLLLALGRSLFIRSFGLPSENPYQLPLFKLIDICNPKQWPTISSNQLQDNGYPVFGANGLIGYFDSFNHPEPTVLVTCRGATCGTVNISPPNCYVTGNSMAMDNPNPELLTTEYLAWVLRLRGMNDVISGSAQPQITRQGLETVTIPVPSIEAQNDFAKELSAVARVTANSRLSENSICGVADSLSARLFESSRK
jgi:type I restriction enzyme S subunit